MRGATRIITGFLAFVGAALVLALAVFGGVYLLDEYYPSSAENSASSPAKDPSSDSAPDSSGATTGSHSSDTSYDFCSTLTEPCTPYVVEKACTTASINGEEIYVNHADTSFLCVHPVSQSPRLGWVNGVPPAAQIPPYCVTRHGTIACSATRPITENDLIEADSPSAANAALVVEPSCTRVEIAGQVLYYRPDNSPPFFCVHPASQSPNLSAGEVVNDRIPGMCAAQAQKIFCSADRPITTEDLVRWRVVQTLLGDG